jgi:ketosteroid isomerase-like protein
MSQENGEIVRAFFADEFDPGRYLADEAEFIPLMGDRSRGPRGFLGQITDMADQFEAYEVKPERLREAGDVVVADLRRKATSKRSPALIEDRFAQVFTLREGKVIRIESFPTFEEALEAAGLSE